MAAGYESSLLKPFGPINIAAVLAVQDEVLIFGVEQLAFLSIQLRAQQVRERK
jgi:hypothetical protein